MTEERWLSIGGYEGLYEVSDYGRVRSLDHVTFAAGSYRSCPHNKRWKGRVLRIAYPKNGYPSVVLSRGSDQSVRAVHVLVAETFLGPKPFPRACALHKDDKKKNNVVDNLYWGSRAQNMEDCARLGNMYCGTRHWKVALTPDLVRKIRKLRRENGYGGWKISKLLGASKGAVDGVIGGKNWKHVEA